MLSCYNRIVAKGSFSLAGKEFNIGKNLKGKEIGKRIYQRKDGLYSARFLTALESVRKSISKLYQRHGTGLKTPNMPKGMARQRFLQKLQLMNGLNIG